MPRRSIQHVLFPVPVIRPGPLVSLPLRGPLGGGWGGELVRGGARVQVWDLREGRSVRSVYGPHLCGDGLDLAGSSLLTAAWAPANQLQVRRPTTPWA